MNKSIKLGEHAFVTKLAGFEHSKYIQYNATHEKNDIPLVIGKNVKNGKVVYDFDWYIPQSISDALPRSVLNKKCIVIPYVGSKLGELAIFENDFTCHLGSNVAKVELIDDVIDLDYLYYYLKSPFGQLQLFKDKQGSAQPNITMEAIRETVVILFDKAIQKQIASVLSTLDSKITLNNRINAELEAMAKTIYDYWFVQFDFPISKEQAKAMGKPKLEGKPYKASGGKMVWNEEFKREVPAGWEGKSLFDVCNVQYGFPFSTTYFNEEGKGVPVIRIRDIQSNSLTIFSTENDIDEKYLIKEGDVLIGMDGNFHINYWSVDKCYLNQRVVKLSQTILPNIFLKHQVEPFIKLREQSVSRTTVGHLSDKDLKAIRILKPSNEILNTVKPLLDDCLKKIISARSENKKLSELRDWLLPMLMNGQVRIKETAQSKVANAVISESNPANSYFYQTQLVTAIVNASKKHKITHGEMTLAKYTYLVDKIYGVPTYFNYERWHLGPYPKEMKKVVNNKKFFNIRNNEVSVAPQKEDYSYQFQQQVENAIAELASIFNQYKAKDRSHQTELLATVCKVVEDIKSTDLKEVRESMKNWPIDLKTSKFKNKAEKFSDEETKACLQLIKNKGWVHLFQNR